MNRLTDPTPPGNRRAYRSPIREERALRTRQAILGAAHGLFIREGYSGTSMRAIASAAGVAESTLYETFADKATLLWAVVEDAVIGPGEKADPDSLIAAIRAEPATLGRLRVIAAWSRETYERGVAELERVIEEGARSSPRLRLLATKAADERYQATRALVDLVAETLAPVEPDELDRVAQIIWATDSSPVYRMLVEQQGWTPEAYERWILSLYVSLVPDAGGPERHGDG